MSLGQITSEVRRGLRDGIRPLQYLVKILVISRDSLASYKQVDVLVDILDKQLIFQLIYPIFKQ